MSNVPDWAWFALTIFGTILGAMFGDTIKEAKDKTLGYFKALFSATSRLRRAEQAVEDRSPGLWLAPSIPVEKAPIDYERALKNSKPIIVVANLKGGVGKTTTVANLIAHYGLAKGKRVLAIDLDFQGSLSAVILTEADYKNALEKQKDGSPSLAAQLVSGRDAEWVRDTSQAVDGVTDARCISAYYTLSGMENRVMVEWLIGKRKEDIRYALSKTLHDNIIQDRFDIIIIDAPPRLTTATVQALCAATHVLIPTVLDELSAEAAGSFVDQLVTNQTIWPHLKLLGVVGNMTNTLTSDFEGNAVENPLADYEADARRTAEDTVRGALETGNHPLRLAQADPMFPIHCFIPQKAELGRYAGHRIAYRSSNGSLPVQQISRAFDRLGDEIDRRILATRV